MTADQSSPRANDHNPSHYVHEVSPPPARYGQNGVATPILIPDIPNGAHWNREPSLELSAIQIYEALIQQIASGASLQTVMAGAVDNIRQHLGVDRVLIGRWRDPSVSRPANALSMDAEPSPQSHQCQDVEPGGNMLIEAESLSVAYLPTLGKRQTLPWLCADYAFYAQGNIEVIHDVEAVMLSALQQLWFDALQVKSSATIPLISRQHLYGVLVVQQCKCQRCWALEEVELLKRLAMQLAIAIEQDALHQQVHHLTTQLNASLTERISHLRQSLKFAELVRHVTERIRDSLDEEHILETATRELAKALEVDRCKIELYDATLETATVAYEYAIRPPNCMGLKRCMADFPELYESLFQHQPVQFVVPASSNLQLGDMTRLACPIFDDQGLVGNLWLFRPRDEVFHRWEVRIIQQIANECAIAIRQARLYEASQAQVRELERLSQLKDDFLKTISHELRTPLSSIILGVQTLEKVLDQFLETSIRAALNTQNERTIRRLFQTLHTECHRESKLIEDLLTFCYLEAGTDALMPVSIDLNQWINDKLAPFQLRIQNQQQHLVVDLMDNLPPLKTELAYLERIFSELLNNACKYTPQGETIAIATSIIYPNR
ncbi:MAG: GAF domain-containing protein, partial [Merismopedia sp. SIO2A8]|nr:GAF domain-containing protein [Merismopedia sp. SIO2A8]